MSSAVRLPDAAINGLGFFQVQMPDGTPAYTRDGSFHLDAQGQGSTQGMHQLEAGRLGGLSDGRHVHVDLVRGRAIREQQVTVNEIGTELNNPNFAAMAEAVGIRGIRLEKPDDVEPGIGAAQRAVRGGNRAGGLA